MADTKEGFSLRRWSARKLEARREAREAEAKVERPDDPALREGVPVRSDGTVASPSPYEAQASSVAVAGKENDVEAKGTAPDASSAAVPPPVAAPATAAPRSSPALPTLDTLTIDSDYAPFMQAGVEENVKRSALKKLFRDPRFNVMDGLDVYIDDYSKPDPISPDIVRTLVQARYIFNPPATRVNEQGYVEDAPETPPNMAKEQEAASAAASTSSDGCATPVRDSATDHAEPPAITIQSEHAPGLPAIVATAGADERAAAAFEEPPPPLRDAARADDSGHASNHDESR